MRQFMVLAITLSAMVQIPLFAQAKTYEGSYFVPVPSELTAHATFDLNIESLRYDNGDEINLTLPKELTGHEQMLIPMNEVGPERYAGPQGEAQCFNRRKSFVCEVAFSNLDINEEAAKEAIRQRFPDPFEAEQRFKVAEFFWGEPMGIAYYHRAEDDDEEEREYGESR